MTEETQDQLAAVLQDRGARWLQGERIRTEDLLAKYPSLRDSSEHVVELATQEYTLARETRSGLRLVELLERFPGHSAALLERIGRIEAARGLASTLHGIDDLGQIPDASPFRVGRFRIEREIGRGRFGVVYAAYDPRLQRRVAVKIGRYELAHNPEFVRRFEREAVAAARLDHSGIVRVFESGRDGPLLYYVMELCEGTNLADWLNATGPAIDRGVLPPSSSGLRRPLRMPTDRA